MDAPCRILVVDDNPTNAVILAGSLQKEGYEVLTAGDGFAAVELATAQQPDAILLDMMMPGRDGLEVCEILQSQEETTSIPIIFVTAVSNADDMLKAFKAGGSDYVTKPFKTAEVLARVSVHAGLRRAEAALLHKSQQMERLAKELAEANIQLAGLSRTDPLTNLLNRRAWEEAAMREHERFERHGHPYSVLIIDVDQFKSFNDSQGHQAGDECLRSVVGSIVSACRRLDVVGRYGGEEFVVLAPETGAEAALKLAERIRKNVWALGISHPANAVGERVTVSVGVAAVVGMGSWEGVLKQADESLYVAKKAGRNMVYADNRSRAVVPAPASPDVPDDPAKQVGFTAETRATVLIVDDEAASRTLCQTCLEGKGYQVRQASDGRGALAKIAEEPPDVIIMDVMMPEMDGLECTRRLRMNPDTRDIPVIMVSACADRADIVAGLEAGADEYLTKPIRTDELALRVRSMARLHCERMDLLRSNEFRGEQTRILQCLLEFGRALSASTELDEILSHTLAATAEAIGAGRISIMLPDANRQFLTIANCVGLDKELASTIRVPIGEMVAGRVFASHHPMVINAEDQEGFECHIYDSPFFASVPMCSTPLGTPAHTIGVLNITERFGRRPFGPNDLEYIDLIASIAGSAIHRTFNRKARDQACDSIMVALAKLAEHRDSDTGKHVDRVTRYCVILAEELRTKPAFHHQIDNTFIHDLERAAPLHDIGKVAIPDQILLRPGKLTSEEMAIMQSHADIGADTIQSVIERTPGAGFLEMAADIARAHHEWYDGMGYPRGLRGDAIPLPARIAALADVYDAITTKRVYKEAFPHDQAVGILTKLSGTQFAPAVVDAFLTRQQEFAALAAELVDDPTCPDRHLLVVSD
ncbi:MAG: response regulator [Phycisphaerae bacterium]